MYYTQGLVLPMVTGIHWGSWDESPTGKGGLLYYAHHMQVNRVPFNACKNLRRLGLVRQLSGRAFA